MEKQMKEIDGEKKKMEKSLEEVKAFLQTINLLQIMVL